MPMEIKLENIEKESIFVSGWLWIKDLPLNLLAKLQEIAKQAKKIATDDPRRLIHSLKVGLALTLVSLFYYFQPLYSSFGVSAMWAVMTVVVVFEFSVGATLGKGLNRGLATLLAGGLGLGAHHLATVTGKTCEPILIGIFVFLQAVTSTFIRFFPTVKARYDYGMLIFILTFCLISISGLRTDEIIELAHKRLSTILIGASTCVIVSISVYPVWAGQDLHKLVAKNIEKLGCFLEGFAEECVRRSEESANGRSSLVGMNSILDSKSSEETLANFARWEPGHGRFMYRHPWKQYLKIAALTRQCACRVVALNGYLNSNTQELLMGRGSDLKNWRFPGETTDVAIGCPAGYDTSLIATSATLRKTPQFLGHVSNSDKIFDLRAPQEIQEIISRMSSESGKALKELAWAVETMTKPTSYPDSHESNLKIVSKNLQSLLESGFWEEHATTNLSQVIPVAAVASLLNDTVTCVEEIADAIDELSSMANFKCREVEGEATAAAKKNNTTNPHISIVIDRAA